MGQGAYAYYLSLCGRSFLIRTDILCGKFSLCVNTEILNEYEEIFALKMTKEIARNIERTGFLFIRLRMTES